MPTPRKGETKEHYIERCIPMLINEGKPQDQAVAICNGMWDERDFEEETVWERLKDSYNKDKKFWEY